MTISRRFVKKFEEPRPDDDLVGYRNVGELCKDIEALVEILWLSGTRMCISGFSFTETAFEDALLTVVFQLPCRFPTFSTSRTISSNGSRASLLNQRQCLASFGNSTFVSQVSSWARTWTLRRPSRASRTASRAS